MRSGRQSGFVYIGLLIGIAVLGIGLGAVSEVWTQTRQREREQELLFTGNQIRQAITRYYQESPPAARAFPMQLDDLLSDARTPGKTGHYLRKHYPDPVRGQADWGEVRLPGGQLVGVYSLSNEAPLKTAGFALRDKDFEDKQRYSEWVFRSALPAANPVLASGAGFASPTAPVNGLPPALRPNSPARTRK
jgi:type II secretory pathway pseudopilin PulG